MNAIIYAYFLKIKSCVASFDIPFYHSFFVA